jgi:hypothetical protein
MPTAPKKAERKFTSWSFSRWSEYMECPFRAAAKHIDKNKEPQRPATDRGNDWLQKKLGKLPERLQTFTEEFKTIKKLNPLVEQEWAFTSSWKEGDWFDASGKTWFRSKIDLHTPPDKNGLVQITDLKSGKIYAEKGKLQLETYSLAALARYPEAKAVKSELWYVDQGKLLDHEVTRGGLAKLRSAWMLRIMPMFRDRRFAPRSGPHCSWCHLSKTKGGPCKIA